MNHYSLFPDRHNLPDNLGPLCLDFDFTQSKFEPVYSELAEQAILTDEVAIYVTGLTPALTAFLRDKIMLGPKQQTIWLLHYDKGSRGYFKQLFYNSKP